MERSQQRVVEHVVCRVLISVDLENLKSTSEVCSTACSVSRLDRRGPGKLEIGISRSQLDTLTIFLNHNNSSSS